MRDPISDVARLKHILDAILEIEKCVKGVSFDHFRNDSILRYGSVKLLEIIGEAANHLSVVSRTDTRKSNGRMLYD